MIDFKSKADFDAYINSKWLKYVDNGSEGKFYISRTDGMGYKLFSRDEFPKPEYDIAKIIMDNEVNIDSFIFPDSLITINDQLYGYSCRVVTQNLFGEWMEAFFMKDGINYKKLKEAYTKFKSDVFLLSQKGIKIFDLSNNLLFDGERLYAVDTCSYHYSEDDDLVKQNFASLDDAMDIIFVLLSIHSNRVVQDRENTGLSILQHIDYIERTLNKYDFPTRKQKRLGSLYLNGEVIY